MSQEIYGPMGELFELGSPLDVSADGGMDLPTLAARFLRDALDSPGNREALRHALWGDPMTPPGPLSDMEMLALLTRRLEDGSLRLRRVREDGEDEARVRRTPFVTGGGGEAQEDEPTPPPDEEVKIKDWILECHHHSANNRDLFEKGTRIEVVPDKGKTTDTVKVHWRDDYLGSMPGSLEVSTPGRAAGSAAQSGSHPGGYTTYGVEVAYLGDLDIINILNPGFWRAYKEKTTHTVRPGPTSIPVVVYNPRQFKFEFKLPPLAGYKGGAKYEAEGAKNIKALARGGELKEIITAEDAHWSPSSLAVTGGSYDSSVGPEFEPPVADMKLFDVISLERDGKKVELDLFTTIGSILKYADTFRKIIEMVKDYAPKVGWYIDWNLQLMQGGLVVEWYWKEHTDHRVYQFIDVAMKLTIFSVTFEIGIGVSACSFKLQIYASLSGELGVECGMKRESPDGAPGFRLPGVKGKITGALGARAEAGYIFKFHAKGETAIEAEAFIGINQRNSMVSVDARARWTGIKATCETSAGALGISWTDTHEWELVPPGPWWGLEWPQDTPYSPPTMSQAAISRVILGVLTRGWDIRVFSDDGDTRYSLSSVADLIAARVERDSAFDKTPKAVDALANAIREDLDVIGERNWSRDWVALTDLRRYLSGSVKGCSLAVHLEAGASPTRKLLAANA